MKKRIMQNRLALMIIATMMAFSCLFVTKPAQTHAATTKNYTVSWNGYRLKKGAKAKFTKNDKEFVISGTYKKGNSPKKGTLRIKVATNAKYYCYEDGRILRKVSKKEMKMVLSHGQLRYKATIKNGKLVKIVSIP